MFFFWSFYHVAAATRMGPGPRQPGPARVFLECQTILVSELMDLPLDDKAKQALGQRLIELRGNRSQAEFASYAGVHKNTLVRYEIGERLPDAAFFCSLERLGVNLHWLITGHGSRHLLVSDISADMVKEQGGGNYAASDDADYVRISELRADSRDTEPTYPVAFSRQWLDSRLNVDPNQLSMMRAQGNAMAPVIDAGDWVLIDTRPVDSGFNEGVYLLKLSGNMLLRRIESLTGNRYRLSAFNPSYSAIEIAAGELHGEGQDRIIGRVVWVGNNLVD